MPEVRSYSWMKVRDQLEGRDVDPKQIHDLALSGFQGLSQVWLDGFKQNYPTPDRLAQAIIDGSMRMAMVHSYVRQQVGGLVLYRWEVAEPNSKKSQNQVKVGPGKDVLRHYADDTAKAVRLYVMSLDPSYRCPVLIEDMLEGMMADLRQVTGSGGPVALYTLLPNGHGFPEKCPDYFKPFRRQVQGDISVYHTLTRAEPIIDEVPIWERCATQPDDGQSSLF